MKTKKSARKNLIRDNFKSAKHRHIKNFASKNIEHIKEEIKTEEELLEKYRKQNLKRSLSNENENFLARKLDEAKIFYVRQYVFGSRIFDFYLPKYKIVLEVDDVTHKDKWEAELINDVFLYDAYNMKTLRTMPFDVERIQFIIKSIKSMSVKKTSTDCRIPYPNQKYQKRWFRRYISSENKSDAFAQKVISLRKQWPAVDKYIDQRNSYFEECYKHNFRKDTRKTNGQQ